MPSGCSTALRQASRLLEPEHLSGERDGRRKMTKPQKPRSRSSQAALAASAAEETLRRAGPGSRPPRSRQRRSPRPTNQRRRRSHGETKNDATKAPARAFSCLLASGAAGRADAVAERVMEPRDQNHFLARLSCVDRSLLEFAFALRRAYEKASAPGRRRGRAVRLFSTVRHRLHSGPLCGRTDRRGRIGGFEYRTRAVGAIWRPKIANPDHGSRHRHRRQDRQGRA